VDDDDPGEYDLSRVDLLRAGHVCQSRDTTQRSAAADGLPNRTVLSAEPSLWYLSVVLATASLEFAGGRAAPSRPTR
jgi:hypothetical protein